MDEKNERHTEDIENLEVEALKDADLEDVAGGDSNGSSSCCTYNIKTTDAAE